MSRRDLFALILMACLLVAGIGAAASYLMHPFQATGPGGATSPSLSRSGSDGEMFARLKDYTRSFGAGEPASTAATDTLQPDVSSMIEKLASRLEAAPADIKGWRMLGWSYFHTGRYEQAAAAYARALQLDPDSAELKRSHEGAKAKALDSAIAEDASSFQSDGVGKRGGGLGAENIINSEAMTSRERYDAIRSMVDGLAERLKSSPRDIEGWARLMRSRVVLGEREVAETAFRKALEVFKDDTAASGKIEAAAIALGLKAE